LPGGAAQHRVSVRLAHLSQLHAMLALVFSQYGDELRIACDEFEFADRRVDDHVFESHFEPPVPLFGIRKYGQEGAAQGSARACKSSGGSGVFSA
jgi:hypothetical protein